MDCIKKVEQRKATNVFKNDKGTTSSYITELSIPNGN